ncbi:MAG: thioredoxin domain-containing protein [Chthonomonas sp.]|nr:thioredoxin domain-containing protein [Chthonomonas sp.]
MNRLAGSHSPYLRQHADNPVHWWPWGEEAFAEATRRNVPVFLSVGYSTCHWCHVMARESFSDPAVAAFLNEKFVAIKVDREEFPDVDDAYMAAVQLSSGRGGWPMTVFMAPDRRPFFAGTYFPPERHGQVPSFRDLLRQIDEAWTGARTEVQTACEQFDKALRESRSANLEPFSGDLSAELLHDCARDLEDEFDAEYGGFGNAPKFPPHTALEFLAAYAKRPDCLLDASAHMARWTLRSMILGGIHDLVGGGFHRYSTDAEWLLPHFEKMLTDNGQLLSVMAATLPLTDGEDEALLRLAGQGIVGWVAERMTDACGAFFTAQNADTEGREGKTYVWHDAEIASQEFKDAFGVIPMGNFLEEATRQRTGENILIWSSPESPVSDGAWRFAAELAELKQRRDQRAQPSTDTKMLASANGLMIRGLADWARATGDAQAQQMAQRALAVWAEQPDWPHMIADGKPMGAAYLDDVAYLGLAAEACIPFAPEAADFARRCGEKLADFPGLVYSSAAHEDCFGPALKPLDQAVPSPVGAAIRLMVRQAIPCESDLIRMSGWMHRAPHASETLHLALMERLDAGKLAGSQAEWQPNELNIKLQAGEKIVGAWRLPGREPLAISGEQITLPENTTEVAYRICDAEACRPEVIATRPGS